MEGAGNLRSSITTRQLSAAKLAAELTIVSAFLLWVLYWFVSPDPWSGDKYVDAWIGHHSRSRFFRTDGRQGVSLVLQTLPWVVVVLLSFVVMEIRARIRSHGRRKTATERSWRMGTYPLWVSEWSPFGRVLTAAEALAILGILLLLAYHFGRATYNGFARIDAGMVGHGAGHTMVSKSWMKVRRAAFYFGTTSIVPFALLWVPVSRGSPLLRLLCIPFERAVRYHIWLAVLTVVLVTLHSVGYIAYYVAAHETDKIFGWETEQERCAVVAGLVAWIVGLLIWFSSLNFFRRRFYDTFFAVHHLYLLFALFWLYHAVWTYHFFVVPLLLFFLDRFIRALQSRREVHIRSVKRLASGALLLKLPIATDVRTTHHSSTMTEASELLGQKQYNALSIWCVRIPSISWQQWHLFSGASSPLDDDRKAVSIIVKPLGDWTNRLSAAFPTAASSVDDTKTAITSAAKCPLSLFQARVEGPYGDESDFYLRYNSLVLIAGGIGITPLLAILADILQRYKLRLASPSQPPPELEFLPSSVEVFHCIRQPEELCLLDTIRPYRILPDYGTLGLTVNVHIYVTSKDVRPDIDTGEPAMMELSAFRRKYLSEVPQPIFFSPRPAVPGKNAIIASSSATAGGGKQVGLALATVFSSLLGFFVLNGIANVFVIKSYEGHSFSNYNRVHVVVACMAIAVVVCGGGVIWMWWWLSRGGARNTISAAELQPRSLRSAAASPTAKEEAKDQSSWSSGLEEEEEEEISMEAGGEGWAEGQVQLGCRPKWEDIFGGLAERYKKEECVGVLVSGSDSLQGNVALECRRNSSFRCRIRPSDNVNPLFHYHSVSFNF